jgi:hypothetical protein
MILRQGMTSVVPLKPLFFINPEATLVAEGSSFPTFQ